MTPTLEERVEKLAERLAGLEEVLGEMGGFSLLAVGGKSAKLTSAAWGAFARLGEATQPSVRKLLAASSKPFFSSSDIRTLTAPPVVEPATR